MAEPEKKKSLRDIITAQPYQPSYLEKQLRGRASPTWIGAYAPPSGVGYWGAQRQSQTGGFSDLWSKLALQMEGRTPSYTSADAQASAVLRALLGGGSVTSAFAPQPSSQAMPSTSTAQEETAPKEGVDYVIIGDYIVPISKDLDGNTYYDWSSIFPAPKGEAGITPSQQLAGREFEFKASEAQLARQERAEQVKREQKMWEQQMKWEQDMFRQQQAAEQQAYLAQLRANPASYIEYAMAAGEQAAVQPWMLPLMAQQYQGAQAGQAIPGFQAPTTPESLGEFITRVEAQPTLPEGWAPSSEEYAPGYETGFEGYTGLTPQQPPNPRNMMALQTPSAQYLARMGPTALAQYGGYERARTGQTPEELQYRLWSQAPPSGRFGGLRWNR